MTPRTAQSLPTPRPRRARAFTLLELMISIAIVLILMLGINQVFSIASQSISAGQALSTVQRDNRSAHAVIYEDLKNAVLADSPFFMIYSDRVAAFRNAEDQAGDIDYRETDTLDPQDQQVRSVDFDADNVETPTPRSAINARNHRVDMLQFFARDIFRRQTGNDGVFTSSLASNEAYIVYGHLRQPTDAAGLNTAGARDPGIEHNQQKQIFSANPNNFYAQQWVLGRTAMVLREPELVGTDLVIYEEPSTPGTEQRYIGRRPTAPAASLAPLDTRPVPVTVGGASTLNGTVFDDVRPEFSRYDLAGTSIRLFTDIVATAIAAAPEDWYLYANFRYTGFPTPTKPHTASGTARTAPIFVRGCTQFIVEYAGDFTTQDFSNGAVLDDIPDGTIDFVYQSVGGMFSRRTRWYGFPRNVDTSDDTAAGEVIKGSTHANAGAGGENLVDVVPLRDVLIAAGVTTEAAPFEKHLNPAQPGGSYLNEKRNYADPASGVALADRYICAWGPPGTFTNWSGAAVPDPPYPKMIRVTLGIDDVKGNLSDAQLYEYVIDLP